MKKKLLTFLLSIVTIATLAGCGSKSSAYTADAMDAYYDNGGYAMSTAEAAVAYDDSDYAYKDYEEEMVAYEGSEDTVITSENATTSNRKLIKTVDLSVETKEYDSLISGLSSTIEEMGGYIEYMDVYNGSTYNNKKSSRHANLTVRIPAKKLSGFVNVVGDRANITYRTESVVDVTLSYVDMQSHKNMLIAERDHLTELMKQAETIEDMITIEDRLTTIRYEIDSMESQLRTYDNQVDYSTVTINISEVLEYTPAPPPVELTTWERISQGFVESVKDVCNGLKEFFIDFIINIPFLIVWAIIITIIVFIIKGLLRLSPKYRAKAAERKTARKERKAAKKAEKELAKANASADENSAPANEDANASDNE